MTDRFTLTLTYSRKEILSYAQRGKDMGGGLLQIREFLNQIYPAWSMDMRTSCMVELMFRDESDMFYSMYTEKLAELNAEWPEKLNHA
jgi:hypothetical protein